MKKIILFLLITTFSYSQNKSFTIKQIDSICLKSKKYIEQKFEIERSVSVSRKKTLKVKTDALLKIYKNSYLDTIKIDSMAIVGPDYPIPQPEIIKATYEYETIYNKKSVEYVFVELYYENNKIKNIKVLNTYYNGTYSIFTNFSSLEKDNDITYFSFCESFNNWIYSISKKIDNIFYERKWK